MLRRSFGHLAIGLFVPAAATAVTGSAVRRIGSLGVLPDSPQADRERWKPLRELGWSEGQNLQIERRAGGTVEGLKPQAIELVRSRVEIIITDGPNPTLAAMSATTTIPIVFRVASDAVLSGIVRSLARPEGNVTGFSISMPEVEAKLLSLCKELLPSLHRIGMLETSGNPQLQLTRPFLERACRALDIEPLFFPVSSARDIEIGIAQFAQQNAQALLLFSDSFAIAHLAEIVSAALRRGLPTFSVSSSDAREGGALAAYSPMDTEADSKAAYFVDRILRGAKPADLPVQLPTQFDFVINLKTARALGITVPRAVLLRATDLVN